MLTSLPYYGGKSAGNANGTGPWIASLLGHDPSLAYIEPFAGMAGVLLCRVPAATEMLNDADENIITWWRAVRDHGEEFQRLIDLTPHSRAEYCRCLDAIHEPDVSGLDRALAVHVVLTQNAQRGLGAAPSQWTRNFDGGRVVTRYDLATLTHRMRNVRLECRDAVSILEASADSPCVVYCDPPYTTATTERYRVREFDKDAMASVLREHKGRVAVSGYRDEWDALGWVRNELDVRSTANTTKRYESAARKTEVLWTNFQTEQPQQELWEAL